MISTTQSGYARLICEYPDAFLFIYLFVDGKYFLKHIVPLSLRFKCRLHILAEKDIY